VIFVDSSVWIDYFRGEATPQSDILHRLLLSDELTVGDLVITEVLQGFKSEKDFNTAKKLMTSFETIAISDPLLALKAAKNYRVLRTKGITVRKTIDSLIATRCLEDGYHLLHDDSDFDGYEAHLGLKVVKNSWSLKQ
jgi:predicted nucleic acid-binding protein